MEIQMKTFLKKIAPFILFILTLEIAVPILVDPYNVFHWKRIRDNGVEPNSNYIKMQYILHNPDKFDSFLFGSSRTGFIDVEKIPYGNWYNMSYSEGLPQEHLENLEELIENGIIPKNVMIGVDNISCLVDPAIHENQFYRIPYPRENKLAFFANYFSIRGVIASLEVSIDHEIEDPDYVERYYRSGCSKRDPSLGGQWEGNTPYWENYYHYFIDDALASIRRTAELCDKYDINLILFSNPIYYNTYRHSEYYGYASFLELLSEQKKEGYYNFSGVNDITRDKNNFYEARHYTEEVGDMIIDRIFNNVTDETLESQGFGYYVTEERLDEFKEVLANH